MSIATKAMVVNLRISMWNGYRLDKESTRKLIEDAQAHSDAVRVNKHLVPPSALKDVKAAANAARAHFYEHTLPWKDNADRLLTRAMYMKFIEEHEALAAKFTETANKFLDSGYATVLEKSAFRMGALFNPSDYPTISELRHKFSMHMDIDAVTEVGDFRVEMDADEVNTIRADMERAMGERLTGAMGDVWGRLAAVVGHFAERMSEEDNRFRKSTLDNLESLVDILPQLNLLDDPELERIRIDVKNTLCGLDAKDLRKDVAVRKEVAGEAKRIMGDMAGFMNAFQPKETA